MATLATPVVGAPCTRCGWALVTERGAEPWCPQCGWNIERFEPARRRPEIGWRWVDRLTFRTAYRLNARQFAALSGRTVDRIGFSWTKALLTVISLVLLALVLGIAAAGVWLIVDIGGIFGYIFGIVALGMAWVLRPQLGRISKDANPVTSASAPTLYRLIGEVAAASGAPLPHTVLCSTAYNASSSAYGLRRRRVLSIGLALWVSLTPQQRVALLGHELGHFVNGDVRRGPLTSLAFTTFDNLSKLTRPDRNMRAYGMGRSAGLAALGDLAARPLMWVIHTVFAMLHVGVEWIGLRATHRAEYGADEVAAQVGGSAAATGLFDMLMMDEVCKTVLRRAARTDPSPAAWRLAIDESRENMAARAPRLRQLSMRDQASLFRSHPPAGLRAQMTASRSQVSAKVVLSEADAARIDQELAGYLRSLRTDLIN